MLTPNRPYLTTRYWEWRDEEGNATPGIGLFRGRSLHAHLTYEEARRAADRMHDLVDAAGNPEPPLPTTDAEQE